MPRACSRQNFSIKDSAAIFVGGFTVKIAVASLISFLRSPLRRCTSRARDIDKGHSANYLARRATVGERIGARSFQSRFGRTGQRCATGHRADSRHRSGSRKARGTSAQGSRGSGFIIDPLGYILTAHHVIDKAKEIEIDSRTRNACPRASSPPTARSIVAILKIKTERGALDLVVRRFQYAFASAI